MECYFFNPMKNHLARLQKMLTLCIYVSCMEVLCLHTYTWGFLVINTQLGMGIHKLILEGNYSSVCSRIAFLL